MNAKTLLAGMFCATLFGGAALAVPLAPGDQVNLNGTTTAQTPWLAGSGSNGIIQAFEIVDAGGNAVFQGSFVMDVVESNDLGTLRFRHRIVNTQAVGNRRVTRVDLAGYQGFQTNVDYTTDGSGVVGPDASSRTASGTQVAFFFGDAVLPAGSDSLSFFVHTEATAFNSAVQARITLNTGETVVIGGLRGPALTDCPGDTNGDGIVNFADLNTVLTNFGDECD
jgi:hypothetical protein